MWLYTDDSVFYKYPDHLRLPLIYYYGHTACFYANKMVLGNLLKVLHSCLLLADRTSTQYERLLAMIPWYV